MALGLASSTAGGSRGSVECRSTGAPSLRCPEEPPRGAQTGPWGDRRWPLRCLSDFAGSLTVGRRCYMHAVSTLRDTVSETASPRTSPGPPSDPSARPPAGREVPSELGAGGSCRAFAPYALRLAGRGPGGSEKGLRAETGSQVPPAGHGHPGGGHLSLGTRPGLWEAHALVTVCPSDCSVAGPGLLPVSPPSDVPSPALPSPSRASVSPSPLERCGSSVSGVYDGLRTLDQRGGWRSRPQLDPCLPLAACGSPGDWAPTFHSVANLGDRLLSFFSQQGCGKITRAFRVLLPPDKLAFQCQP